MDAAVARNIAHYSHVEARNRHGELIVEHAARVAAMVPPEARAVAWLHDVLDGSPASMAEFANQGLSPVELAALRLLTRAPDESYELHVLRIAYAGRAAGRLARVVKLAELDDHIARDWLPGAPPYEWARRHIAVGAERAGDAAAYASSRPSMRARATA